MQNPLVTIIIPVYNGSEYMREAIDSALAQTYKNIEIIVVNDGSNDGGLTEEIALSYGDKIRYVRKENGGVSSALNLGLNLMKGEYFSWLSHDDAYLPTKIEKQVELLEQGDSNTIILCATQQINSDSLKIGQAAFLNLPSNQKIGWQVALKHIIDHSCNGCALLIPKAIFTKCGNFNQELRYSQDFLMWIQMFLSGCSLIYLDEPLVLSRVHQKQVTLTRRDLFLHDSTVIANILAPKLAKISTKEYGFLYNYAKTSAVHLNRVAVKKCILCGRKTNTITAFQSFKLRFICLYGAVRPVLRKLYYRIVKRTKIS